MAKRHDWQPDTAAIPTTPGVYRFMDDAGRVLYVGKAKNLRSRLTNYFQKPASLHERTRRVVSIGRSFLPSAKRFTWNTCGSSSISRNLMFDSAMTSPIPTWW
jgi:hypothetical protein